MVKKINSREEYKIVKQTSKPKKIALWFISVWGVGVIAPVMFFCLTQSTLLKEWAVVRAVASLNKVLQSQYTDLTNKVINQVNIQQYVTQIKVPDIKLDHLNETSQKVATASDALAQLGVKNLGKIEETSEILQEQLQTVQKQLQKSVTKIQKSLETDVQSALKKELSKLAQSQVQKQLGLNNLSYQHLLEGTYGLVKQADRRITSTIYQELIQSQNGILKQPLVYLDAYFCWLKWIISAFIFLILLIPVGIVWWIAKKLSANFIKCPYCDKVFLSKAAQINLLKMLSK